jgi:hypothetical protein
MKAKLFIIAILSSQSLFAQLNFVRAIIKYNAYDDYVWDDDEKKYMGVLKIGTYVEDIDVVNHTSGNGVFIAN